MLNVKLAIENMFYKLIVRNCCIKMYSYKILRLKKLKENALCIGNALSN